MLARLKGFEPLTPALEGRCSIQLSYRRILCAVSSALIERRIFLERVMGIGPTRPAWKAGVLPLNYTRITLTMLAYFTKYYFDCQMFLLGFLKIF